jgi:hypothetical protein
MDNFSWALGIRSDVVMAWIIFNIQQSIIKAQRVEINIFQKIEASERFKERTLTIAY